ncbi:MULTISPECIES: iron uptake transporter permease EfeU [Subtercola]|uniref:iron uptake transporter permease EfeU n=1 Tax=Subtercola TaxID=120212 RepID=UPI00191CA38A|nr:MULTISPECIES: iron uptake transporter permease EfeU [Subtercola]MEA9986043.1 FTR1 family protein [Subtercola sp. RTI3]
MLATFVIGLREGLEAALIVGIIAAFLKRNGHSLKSMWIGVIAAMVLSVAVGAILEVISVGLPQAEQEGMESIIGAVAVVMVTAMIVWMSKHARTMRRELESTATEAIKNGSVLALAGMAFLAVLREGFETSVFMLAAFQSSVSPLTAGLGALLGLLLAVLIGYGIYRGGVRLNLGKFFTVTGVFLVFVAAGLVMSALRTAHEAGWIVVGQNTTVDLAWLAPGGSVQAALITGVLGIPADPRVIEVLGWALYLVPVLLFVLWPVKLRPGIHAYRVQFSLAGAAAIAALVLVVAVPAPAPPTLGTGPAALTGTDGRQLGTAQLTGSDARLALETTVLANSTSTLLESSASTADTHLGQDARTWSLDSTVTPTTLPTTLTLADLDTLNGGRTPVGINRQTNPGPFTAAWKVSVTEHVWAVGTTLLDASRSTVTTLALSGGGLTAARTVTVTAGDTAAESLSWSLDSQHTEAVAAELSAWQSDVAETQLFKTSLPAVLAVAALVLLLAGLRGFRASRRRGTALPEPGGAGDAARASGAPDSLSPDSDLKELDLHDVVTK